MAGVGTKNQALLTPRHGFFFPSAHPSVPHMSRHFCLMPAALSTREVPEALCLFAFREFASVLEAPPEICAVE